MVTVTPQLSFLENTAVNSWVIVSYNPTVIILEYPDREGFRFISKEIAAFNPSEVFNLIAKNSNLELSAGKRSLVISVKKNQVFKIKERE